MTVGNTVTTVGNTVGTWACPTDVKPIVCQTPIAARWVVPKTETFTATGTAAVHRGTELIRNKTLLGPYKRTIPRVLGWCYREELFLMGEVPLCAPPPRLSTSRQK